MDDYFYRHKYNPCLQGNIAITGDGNILPCPNWKLTKDLSETCSECEYRYFCSDCSLIEMAVSKGKLNKKVFCLYDQENGIWHKNTEKTS